MERTTAGDGAGAEHWPGGGATILDDATPSEARSVQPVTSAIVLDDPTLGLVERILLGTDATVVRLLEVCFHEVICTAQLSQVCTPALPTDAELELTGDERILRRKTLLQGSRTGRTYVYAESAVVLDRLERGMAEALLSTSETIGHLLLADRVESFRELVRVGRMHAGPLGDRFGLDGEDELSCRTYRIIMGGQPAMLITEYLPPSTAAPEDCGPAEARATEGDA